MKSLAVNRRQKKKRHLKEPFTIHEGDYKLGKLSFSHRRSWTEESFVSDASGKETIGKTFNVSKLPLVGLVVLFCMFILLVRTAWLQIVKGDYYYKMAEGNRIRVERIETKRGVIYDRNDKPLVRNIANFLLYFIPADLPDEKEELDNIIREVSEVLFAGEIKEIKTKLASVDFNSLEAYQPLFIADNIEYEKALHLYLKSVEWSGVVLTNKTRREYLTSISTPSLVNEEVQGEDGLSLSHILGYTGKISESELEKFGAEYSPIDYIGKMGIEYFWENELKGENGKKQIEVDAFGKEKKIISYKEGEDGHNLVLSLDINLQNKLEEILVDNLVKLKLSKAVTIVMDPENGEILAMVSIPTYNNNLFARGITQDEYDQLASHPDNPLFNRSIGGEYPSGSTIKPVIATAALEEGLITEHTSFLSVGGISIGQWFFPDWRADGHGVVDVRRAIAESVNTFFYYIGGGHEDFQGLGVEKIIEYAKLFGLGAQTGVDLAGEANGFLPTKDWKEETKGERWYIGDTYHLSIGQGDLLVTPLQVALYTSIFANGGSIYRPHFIRQILTSNDRVIKEIEDEPVRRDFVNGYNIIIVRQAMRQAVTSGSARSLQSVPVAVAGKTGTAQWSSKHRPHAWFTGFAPYSDPEIVITVLIEEGGEGSDTAIPIAREFLTWYFEVYKKADKQSISKD